MPSESNMPITFEESQEILRREALSRRAARSETIPVREGAGRVLLLDVLSRIDLPPFNRSMMDGYAVREGDERESYRLIEVVPAGREGSLPLEPGTCVKVMTGAPVPHGTGRVVKKEDTEAADAIIRITGRDTRTFIAPRGSDCGEGDVVASAGERLGALDVANILSCGVDRMKVARRPRAAVIVTGGEIVEKMEDLESGKIFDSNGPMLEGLLADAGFPLLSLVRIPDDPDRLEKGLSEALDAADLVLLSGGVSAGDFDHVPQVMEACGLEIRFSRISLKPGKPLTLASGDRGMAMGLPGNPVSVLVTFHLFALPALAALEGEAWKRLFTRVRMRTAFSRRRARRTEFVPARVARDGRLVQPDYHGSGHLMALRDADGFFRINRGVKKIAAGAAVPFFKILGKGRWIHGL